MRAQQVVGLKRKFLVISDQLTILDDRFTPLTSGLTSSRNLQIYLYVQFCSKRMGRRQIVSSRKTTVRMLDS